MVKRQRLLSSTITLLLILALAVGIIFATVLGTNVKGGESLEGNGSTIEPSAPFADMPDVSDPSLGFIEVKPPETTPVADPGKWTTKTDNFSKTANIVDTAEKFLYVLTHNFGTDEGKEYRFILEKNFYIDDATFLVGKQLNLTGHVVLDGNGKNVVSKIITPPADINKKQENFGGFLGAIYDGAQLHNLNYYLDPSSLVILANNYGSGQSAINVTLGGFVGVLRSGSIVNNCNINIYGTVYGLRMGPDTYWTSSKYARPRVGGAFGALEGQATNNVFNIVNATVSASSHSNEDGTIDHGWQDNGFRTIGGIAGIVRSNNNIKNNVFNVSPSTLVGADLLGYFSNLTATKYNEVGIYFGNTDGVNANQNLSNNVFINYNNMYNLNSAGNDRETFMIPNAVGYHDGYRANGHSAVILNVYGASFFGDDVKFKVGLDKKVHQYVNAASWSDVDGNAPSTAGYTKNTDEFKDGYVKDTFSDESLYFYKLSSDKEFLINNSYDWNRLVSISGAAYFDKNLYTETGARPLDPIAGITENGIKTKFEAVRQHVKINTKDNNGVVRLDSYASAAFALYARIEGNQDGVAENNVFDVSEMTRNSGVIQYLFNNSLDKVDAGVFNLTIINRPKKSIEDGSAVRKCVGGFIDYVAEGIKIDNCIIDNVFNYSKNGINNWSMSEKSAGELYYGGVFGYVDATITNSIINSASSIASNLERRKDTVYMGGFAAGTNGLTIKDSIVNVNNELLHTHPSYRVSIGGFLARAAGAVNINNVQLGVEISGLTGGVYKGGDNTSKAAGLVGEFMPVNGSYSGVDFTMHTVRLDMKIRAGYKDSLNLDKAYIFGRVDGSGITNTKNYNFTDVAINMNNQYGFGKSTDTEVSDGSTADNKLKPATYFLSPKDHGVWNASNVWFYNAAEVGLFKGLEENAVNTISLVGNTASNSNASQLIIKGMHNVARGKTLAETIKYLKSQDYKNNFDFGYEFTVEPSEAFYDMRRMDGARDYYTKDKDKNYPVLVKKDDPGLAYYTGTNITGFDALETTNPLASDPDVHGHRTDKVNAGLGWFTGTNNIVGALDKASYVARVAGIFKMNEDGVNRYIDKSTGNQMNVVEKYEYALRVPSKATNDHIVGLLSTYDIKDAGDWNQVAKNVNAGIKVEKAPIRIANNVTVDPTKSIISMGYKADRAMNATIKGTTLLHMVPNPDYDASKGDNEVTNPKLIEVEATPVVTTNFIQGVGGHVVGLFGYIGENGVVKDFDIHGAELNLAADDVPKTGVTAAVTLGTIAAINAGTINNVHVVSGSNNNIGYKTDSDVRLGLLVGENAATGTISNVSYITEPQTKLSLNIDHNPLTNKRPNIYIGGIAAVNSGKIYDTVTNLSNFTFIKKKPAAEDRVAGGVAYNTGKMDGIYVSVQNDTLDKSLNKPAAIAYNNGGTIANTLYSKQKNNNSLVEVRAIDSAGAVGADQTYGGNTLLIDDAGESLADQADVVFSTHARKEADAAYPRRDFQVELRDAKGYAVAGYFGVTITGTVPSYEDDTVLRNNLKDINDLGHTIFEVSLISNYITNVKQWNNLVNKVNKGAAFKGFTFDIRNNITLDPKVAANADEVYSAISLGSTHPFEGTINGGGYTLTLNDVESVAGEKYSGLIGCLGVSGQVVGLNVVVKNNYTNKNSSGDSAAVVVAKNLGTIEDVTLTVHAGLTGSVNINAKNSGLFVGTNAGTIKACVVDAKEVNSDHAVVSLSGTNVGILAGNNTIENTTVEGVTKLVSSGNINGVSIMTGTVAIKGGKSKNLGYILGSNRGKARISSVVNTMYVSHSDDTQTHYYNGNANYYIDYIEDDNNIENVWTLLKSPVFTIKDKVGSNLRYRDDLFYVMYNYQLGSQGNITAEAQPGSVNFTISHDASNYFYGYVSDDQNAATDNSSDSMTATPLTCSGKADQKSHEYAAIFANTTIATEKDLINLRDYTGDAYKSSNAGRVYNGIVFTVNKNTTIELTASSVMQNAEGVSGTTNKITWTPFESFNHILSGSGGSVIATSPSFNATYIFEGLFDTITPSGGIRDIDFRMTGVAGQKNNNVRPMVVTPEVNGFIVKHNYGTITSVNVDFTGRVYADSTMGAAGVLAGYNYENAKIDHVSVNMTYTDHDNRVGGVEVASTVSAYNAGAIAGVNAGIIKDSSIVMNNTASGEDSVLNANTNIIGTNAGGLVGYNQVTGIILDDGKNDTAKIKGRMQGINIGAIAGVNDGVVDNIKSYVLGYGSRIANMADVNMNYGGIAGINRGLINKSEVNMAADSLKANLNKITGIAVQSSGTINDVVVNITAPLVAKDLAAGAVYTTETEGAASVINGKTIPAALYNVVINIDNKIAANNAVGFIFKNGAAVRNIVINVNNQIIGVTYASMMGKEIIASNDIDLYTFNGVAVVPSANGTKVNNSKIVINGVVAPMINPTGECNGSTALNNPKGGTPQYISSSNTSDVNATYVLNEGNVEYQDAWLVRKNTYHIDKGSVGLNEYKHIADGELDVNVNEDKIIITSVSGSSKNVFVREEGLEDKSTGNTYEFTPVDGSKNRVVIFSQYRLDIGKQEANKVLTKEDIKNQFVEVNHNMETNDWFYDVTIKLYEDVVVTAEFGVSPFGNMTDFNSVFDGQGHTITLERNFDNNDRAGLFGTIGKAGVVKNLIVNIGSEKYSVAIGSQASQYAGGLAGVIEGKVENVAVKIFNTMNETSPKGAVKEGDTASIPTIEASKMSGAFAGMIDNGATLTNAWVFMQSGRYAPANGDAGKLTPSAAKKNTYNVVNLGGVEDVDVVFSYDNIAGTDNGGFKVVIKKSVLDDIDPAKGVYNWKDGTGRGIDNDILFGEDTLNNVALVVFEMPKNVNRQVYSVSLIKNTISTLTDLINLSNNQSGFNISPDEVFELTDNIVVEKGVLIEDKDAEGTLKQKEFDGKFFAIGSAKTNRDFKSTFNGNGFSIIFADTVTMTETTGEYAGLFGRIGASAKINDLKVVINTDKLEAETYAGGLAGDNQTKDLRNIIVEINKKITIPKESSMQFGGVFGTTAPELEIKGVYLVKEFDNKITPVAGIASIGRYNVINRYRKDSESIEFNIDKNNNKIVVVADNGDANYVGVINTTLNTANVDKTQITGKVDTEYGGTTGMSTAYSQEYAAVFVNTAINASTLKDMVTDIDNGYNVRWLEYKLVDDILLEGTIGKYLELVGPANSAKNALKATINGQGYTVKMRFVNIVGEYAGVVGNVAKEGVVKNVVVDAANVTVGHAKDDTHDVGTVNGGLLVGRNDGTIQNAVVYNKGTEGVKKGQGIKFVSSGANNVVVGLNTRTIDNTWLMVDNKDTKPVVDKDINVVNLVGNDIQFQKKSNPKFDNIVIENGAINAYMATPNGFAYMYNMADMSKNKNEKTNEDVFNLTFPAYEDVSDNRMYVLADFSLVLHNMVEYGAFVDRVNNGNTSFKDVEVSIASNIGNEDPENDKDPTDDHKLIIGTRATEDDPLPPDRVVIEAIGTRERPFNGIFNGNRNKIIVNENVTFEGTMYAGIFGNVAPSATIKNVEFYMYGDIVATPHADKTDPENIKYSDVYAGIIAYNRGTVENVIMLATNTMDIEVDTAGIDAYSGKKYLAGGVGYTEAALINTWYVRSTDTTHKPSTQAADTSKISTLTLVGKINPVHTAIDDKFNIVFSATDSDGKPITDPSKQTAVGTFYSNFDDNTHISKLAGYSQSKYTTVPLVYEWVNYNTNPDGHYLLDAASKERDDFAQLAQDTKGGYSFDGIIFDILNPINITADAKYSIGEFGGIMQSVVKEDVADIVLTNNINADTAKADNPDGFVLFDTITSTGGLDGLYIKIGTDTESYKAKLKAGIGAKPKGLVVNSNKGSIKNVKLDANVSTMVKMVEVTDGTTTTTKPIAEKVKDFSVFVGTNNGTIANSTIDVTTKGVSEANSLPTAIRVDGMYGHIAVVNNKNITNVTVNANEAKVLAGSGKFAYGVAYNNVDGGIGTISGVTINIGAKSTITASSKNTNTYVAGLVGYNKGVVETSDVIVVGAPDHETYLLDGYNASFLVGDNNSGKVNNLVANATYNIRNNGTGTTSKVQSGGFVRGHASMNLIDMQGGFSDYNNITILLSDSDKELVEGEINTVFANVIVLTGLGTITTKKTGNTYTFVASEKDGSKFNGWFVKGKNTLHFSGTDFIPSKSVDKDVVDEPATAVNGRYEVVFYNTIIDTEEKWNLMADLVNHGKNIEKVVFELDKTLDKPLVLYDPTPVGTEDNPFRNGHFNGNGKTVVIDSNKMDKVAIDATYAGLFGYAENAEIANLNVEIKEGVTISGEIAAGAILGRGINTKVCPGTFKGTTGTEFDAQASNLGTDVQDRVIMTITNNGTVKIDGVQQNISVGGVVGDMSRGKLEYITLENNGAILAEERMGTFAGGIIGRDIDTTIGSITVDNKGEIRGNTVGGAIGSHKSVYSLDNFRVDSYAPTSIIIGKSAGGFAGVLAGNVSFGNVKYSNSRPEAQNTKALVPSINGTNTVQNTWIVMNTSSEALNTSVEELNKGENKNNYSIRVLRTADVNNIEYIAKKKLTDGEVFASIIADDGTFDYWRYTDATKHADSLYDVTPAWFTANGIKRTTIGTPDSNIDITLEKLDTVNTIDELKGLAMFANNTKAKDCIDKSTTTTAVVETEENSIKLGKSLDLSTITITVDLLGRKLNGTGKTIIIDKDVIFNNGTLDNIYIALDTDADNSTKVTITNSTDKPITLGSKVVLSDSEIYEIYPDITTEDRDVSGLIYNTQFLGKFGTFDTTKIQSNASTFVSRNASASDATIILGNVPLYVDGANGVRGYNSGVFRHYIMDDAWTGHIVYFMDFIGVDPDESELPNIDKAFSEIDTLLKSGYTFKNQTIVVNMDIALAENFTLGMTGLDATPFLGTLDGEGHKLTYPVNYAPLFGKIGSTSDNGGIVKNFVLYGAVKNEISALQGTGTGAHIGTMENIVIINTGTVDYKEADINYDKVIVVQGEAVEGNAFIKQQNFSRMFALNINSNIASVDDAVKVEYLPADETHAEPTFNIISNVSNVPAATNMFAGFYGRLAGETDAASLMLIDMFANGLNLRKLHETKKFDHAFYMYTVSSVIDATETLTDWNNLADNVAKFNTANEIIKFNENVEIGAGAKPMGTDTYASATIDGQGKVITLGADYDVKTPLFDNYSGIVKNLVIDARLNSVKAVTSTIIANDSKTVFENVVIVLSAGDEASPVSGGTAVANNNLLTVVVGEGVTYRYDTSAGTKLIFDRDDTSIIHVEDDKAEAVKTAVYGELNFGITVPSKLYRVEKVSELYSDEHFDTANWATPLGSDIKLSLDSTSDLFVERNVTLSNDKVVIDANGARMVVEHGNTFTLDGTTLNNVIINGLGTVVINNGTINTAIITATLSTEPATGAPTVTNVWVNSKTKVAAANVYTIDLSDAYDNNEELFKITFSDGSFHIWFQDSADKYFVGMTEDTGATYTEGTVAAKPGTAPDAAPETIEKGISFDLTTYADVAKFEYIAKRIGDVKLVGSVQSALDTYNIMVGKVNKANTYLDKKTFVVDGKINVKTATDSVTAVADGKSIVLDGNGVNSIVFDNLVPDALKNVQIQNIVFEFGKAEGNKIAATIGDNTVIITNDETYELDETKLANKDVSYVVVRVMNFDKPGNKHLYNTITGTVTFIKTTDTAFHAKRIVYDETGKDIIDTTEISAVSVDELLLDESNVIDVMFALPIEISANNVTDRMMKNIIKNHDGSAFVKEVLYDATRVAGVDKAKEVLVPINITNIVVKSISGNVDADMANSLVIVDGERYIKAMIETPTVKDKVITIKLDLDILERKTGDIKSLSEQYDITYNQVEDASRYDVTSISDLLNYDYKLPSGLTFVVVEDDLTNPVKAPVVKREGGAIDGKVIPYNRVVKINNGAQVVGELHYDYTVKPYDITANDIRLNNAEYTNDGKNMELALDESLTKVVKDVYGKDKTVDTFLGALKKADIDQYNDIIAKLKAITFMYKNFSIGSNRNATIAPDSVQKGFNEGNFKLDNNVNINGNIDKRSIKVDLGSEFFQNVLREREFDHAATGNTIFSDVTFDTILANATVKVKGVDTPLGTLNDEGTFVPTIGMERYMPSERYEITYRDASAKSFLYIDGYNNRILDVKDGGHRLVSNIKDTDLYAFDLNVENKAKNNYLVKDIKVNITPAIYTIGIEDNTVGYGKTYLSTVNLNNQNFINTIYHDGEAQSGLYVDLTYTMWDKVSTVVGGSNRIYTALPGVENTITAAYDKIVVRTSTTVIPTRNYKITGENVDVANNTVTGGTFKVVNANLNVAVDKDSKSIAFSGITPSPRASIKMADSYNNAGFYTKVGFVNAAGDPVDSKDIVRVGHYNVAIRVMSTVTGEDVTKYINNTNTAVSPSDDGTYFIDDFNISQANARATMKGIFASNPINITYGDELHDVTEFMTFVSSTINALIKGPNPVFNVKLVLGDKDGNPLVDENGVAIEYNDKLPVGIYTLVYDEDLNPELKKNVNVEIKGAKRAYFKVNPRKVNITMTMKGDNEIIYGTPFAGHDIAYTIDTNVGGEIVQKDWSEFVAVNADKFSVTYKDDSLKVDESILDAGEHKFDINSVNITIDDNHVLGNVTIETLKVNPKEVVVSMKAGTKASKYVTQPGKVQITLDRGLLVDGEKPLSAIHGIYVFADVIGTPDVKLIGIDSKNYIMKNTEGVDLAKGILTVKLIDYTPIIDSIMIDQQLNTTTIQLNSKKGDKSEEATIVYDGILTDQEEIKTVVTDYVNNVLGVSNTKMYNLKDVQGLDTPPVVVKKYEPIMPYIVYGVLGLCAVVAAALLISSVVNIHTMPSGFNKDFNFSRDPGKKDTANLMKAVGKRRAKEYKTATKNIAKAQKKGTYYNIENDIFPEGGAEDNVANTSDDEPKDE